MPIESDPWACRLSRWKIRMELFKARAGNSNRQMDSPPSHQCQQPRGAILQTWPQRSILTRSKQPEWGRYAVQHRTICSRCVHDHALPCPRAPRPLRTLSPCSSRPQLSPTHPRVNFSCSYSTSHLQCDIPARTCSGIGDKGKLIVQANWDIARTYSTALYHTRTRMLQVKAIIPRCIEGLSAIRY